MRNHTGCICLTFLHCAFSNVSSNGLHEWMHNHTGCICLTFPHSNCLPQRMQNHTGCICLTFLHCAFSNVSSKRLDKRMQNHTGCICLTFLHCAFSNVSSNYLREKMHNHTGCICLIFPFVHWQLLRWVSSPGNYHDHGFVPSPQAGKVCPLLLLVLNWEHSNVKLPRKRKWKWN